MNSSLFQSRIFQGMVIFVIIAVSFLFSPKPKSAADYQGKYIHLNEHMGFLINGDTWGFMHLAFEPSKLLVNGEARQSRPLYVLAGTVLGQAVYIPLNEILKVANMKDKYTDHQIRYVSYYIGFVIFNFILVGLSLWMAIRILDENFAVSPILFWSLVIFLFSTTVTKAFIWTVHQQMFYVFTPLYGMFFALRVFQRTDIFFYWLCLVTGIGMLFYGNFLIVAAVFLICFVIKNFESFYLYPLKYSVKVISGGLLFLLPTCIWIGVVQMTGAEFYSHEVEKYRQLVWLLDVFHSENFFESFKNNLIHYSQTLGKVFLQNFILVILTAGIIIWNLKLKGYVARIKKLKNYGTVLILLFSGFFIFYAILGFYTDRLTSTLIPIVVLALPLGLSILYKKGEGNKLMPYGILFLAIVQHLFMVFRSGPYS